MIELELLPTESTFTIHAVAIIRGSGSRITLIPAKEGQRKTALPLLVGYSMPAAGEGMAPVREQPAEGLLLLNETAMPLVVSAKAKRCELGSRGKIQENHGQEITLKELP